ncbi:winged helix-turn-helix domain-containing protein [Alicyclobacillus mengziensis]|uniref:Winged helix-turn-helix domain-containing protein n=1 Tax=Alicyclobacillus mengziensis TaxID=2931921 RepID=A0A9X7Z7S9_9BACL|nr:winged helix-turn-helix domain-containing protein [Alicyclobacillus mengziensis]QSO48767.1 winged helix-turn-helix domain-containing protein [Alicyclobacillus mengziensis]
MGDGVSPEKILSDLMYCLGGLYQGIIEVILENKHSDGTCYISQTEIANRLGTSQINVSKRLKKLEKADRCVVKVAPGQYKVNHCDLREHGPIARSLRYMEAVIREPDLMQLPQNVQAELLGLQSVDVQRALAYFKYGVNM